MRGGMSREGVMAYRRRCRGGMAEGSRWRNSWIMSSTSCLVRMPFRSSSSTSAEVSHMVETAMRV